MHTLPFLPSCLDGTPKTQMSNLGRCFSTGCIWFLWQAAVRAALELLGFGDMLKQPMGLCGDIFSSCVWFSFASLLCGMFLLDVSKSPRIFARIPIYGHKDDFPLPLHNHLFFPAAGTAVGSSYVPSVLAWILHQSSHSSSARYNTTLRKQVFIQPENLRLPVDPIIAVAGWFYRARSFNHF